MAYVLKTTIQKEDCYEHKMAYQANGQQAKDGDEVAGYITAWIKGLNGEDERVLSNQMMEIDKKGKSKMNTGTVIRAKVCRGVFALDGLEKEDGSPIETINHKVYDRLPSWITKSILNKINDLIGEDEEDAEE